MSTKLAMTRDINGFNTFGIPFCATKYSATLASADEEKLTVPSSSANWLAIFCIEPGSRIWVANNATAAVPAGSTFAATDSELNVPAKQVRGGDILSFITPDTTADIGVLLYALD